MKAENPVVFKLESWGTIWDSSPNNKLGERFQVFRNMPSGIKLRRLLVEDIGCMGLRRGVEYYYDGNQHRMYSERHCIVVFCNLHLENTGKTYKELKAIYENE